MLLLLISIDICERLHAGSCKITHEETRNLSGIQFYPQKGKRGNFIPVSAIASVFLLRWIRSFRHSDDFSHLCQHVHRGGLPYPFMHPSPHAGPVRSTIFIPGRTRPGRTRTPSWAPKPHRMGKEGAGGWPSTEKLSCGINKRQRHRIFTKCTFSCS